MEQKEKIKTQEVTMQPENIKSTEQDFVSEKQADVETLSFQSIAEIEREQNAIEPPPDINSFDTVDLSPENFNQIKKETNIEAELEQIKDERKSLYKKTIAKIRDTTIALSVFLQLASPAAALAEEKPVEPARQEMVTTPEIAQREELYNKKIDEIRSAAILKDREQVYYIGEKDGAYKFLEAQPGKKNHGTLDYTKIRELLNKGMEVDNIHTHPAHTLSFLSNQGKQLKEKTTVSVPMPPSITDVFAEIAMKRDFGADYKRIHSHVVTPFGKYSLSIEENSEIAKIMNELFDACDGLLDKCGLDEKEKIIFDEILNGNKELISIQHPILKMGKIIEILKNDRSSKAKNIADKLERGINKIGFELLKNSPPAVINDLSQLIDNSKHETEYDEMQTRKLIKEDLELYHKNGIIVKYEPFSNVVEME